MIWRHWRSRGMFGAPRRRRFSESNVGWGPLARAISRRGTSASCCARWWPRLRCCAASRTARLHLSWVSRPIRRSRSGRCGLPPRRRPSRRLRGRTRSPLRRRRSSSRRCQGQMRRIRIRWRPLSAGWRARAARPSRRCRLARAACASSTSMTRSRTVRPRHRNSVLLLPCHRIALLLLLTLSRHAQRATWSPTTPHGWCRPGALMTCHVGASAWELTSAPRSVAHGYEVAIATAGCHPEFVRSFLNRRVDADIFNAAFLNSSAVQWCEKDKARSHYGHHRGTLALVLTSALSVLPASADGDAHSNRQALRPR